MTNAQDSNDLNKISAKNTDFLEEAQDPDAVANPIGSDGSPVSDIEGASTPNEATRTYQHDFDTQSTDTDPVIDEETDDPAEGFQVPLEEYKVELDKLDFGDGAGGGDDDMRELIEDRDENDGNAAAN